MTRFHITISGNSRDMMLALVRKLKISVFDHGIRKLDETYSVDALVGDKDIDILKKEGYKVRINSDVDKEGIIRQKEIGQGNRYVKSFKGEVLEAFRESQNSYLNVEEVESALIQAAASPNDYFIELITLPKQTWEGRQSHALKIGNKSNINRVGVYFLGGVHAREWGSADILINFIEKVSESYRTNTDLTVGKKKFAASEISSIVNGLDIFLFPQVNPDGRNYSMNSDSMWRKNRRPATSHHPNCIGVDLNRNYNFLWNYPLYFNPDAAIQSSTDPCHYEIYIGPAAESEPETKNVLSIMDTNPSICYFIDLHSHGEDILYCWGDSDDQITDKNMNFHNPSFDGLRGNGSYKEFIPSEDKLLAITLADSMASAIQSVRGRKYTVKPSYHVYPTSGASDDYSFSRYFINNNNGKIISYTIEWGNDDNLTPFHPVYSEMKEIISEVTAGLIQFCIEILKDSHNITEKP
jgi:carboxypeptidase T